MVRGTKARARTSWLLLCGQRHEKCREVEDGEVAELEHERVQQLDLAAGGESHLLPARDRLSVGQVRLVEHRTLSRRKTCHHLLLVSLVGIVEPMVESWAKGACWRESSGPS